MLYCVQHRQPTRATVTVPAAPSGQEGRHLKNRIMRQILPSARLEASMATYQVHSRPCNGSDRLQYTVEFSEYGRYLGKFEFLAGPHDVTSVIVEWRPSSFYTPTQCHTSMGNVTVGPATRANRDTGKVIFSGGAPVIQSQFNVVAFLHNPLDTCRKAVLGKGYVPQITRNTILYQQ